MALSYPLAFPTTQVAASLRIRARSAVGMSVSPFSHSQQVYVHAGAAWGPVDVEVPPMSRADAAAWIGFLLGLNGLEGTFLMGNPVETSPRGSWSASSPVVSGAHAAGVRTLVIRNVDGRNWKAGDSFQLGSASSTRLHMVTQDGSQVGSPSTGELEIWPPLRAAVSDAAPLTLASPKGIWRLASNERSWDLAVAQVYGLSFSAIEAL